MIACTYLKNQIYINKLSLKLIQFNSIEFERHYLHIIQQAIRQEKNRSFGEMKDHLRNTGALNIKSFQTRTEK